MKKGDFALNQTAILFLTLVVIILSAMFLTGQFGKAPHREDFIDSMRRLISSGTYNICQEYNGTVVDEDAFSTILFSAYLGKCNDFKTEVKTTFNITHSYIKTFALSREIVDERANPLILSMGECIIPKGYDGVFIGSVEEPYFSVYDTLVVKQDKKALVVCKKQ